MSKDLRKEQVKLLKFEKTVLTMAATLAATGAATAASAEEKMGAGPTEHLNEIQQSVLALAEKVSEAHAALEAQAMAIGAPLIDGGTNKSTILEAVKSTLGIG